MFISVRKKIVIVNPTYNQPVRKRHRFDVYTTSITLKRRRMYVKTSSFAYWAEVIRQQVEAP